MVGAGVAIVCRILVAIACEASDCETELEVELVACVMIEIALWVAIARSCVAV